MTDRWSMTRFIAIGMMAVALLIGGLGVWGSQTLLSGAVIAPGHLEVEGRIQVVEHPDGGVVSEILVREGDLVEAGAPLLRLDGSSLRSELAILEGQRTEIMARSLRLQAERDDVLILAFDPELLETAEADDDLNQILQGQGRLFEARLETFEETRRSLTEQQNQIEAEIEGQFAQISAIDDQIALIQAELANMQSLLDRGLTSASQVLALRREQARLIGSRGETVAATARNRGAIAQLDTERLRLSATRREEAETELRDLAVQMAELQERIGPTQVRIARLDLRAPMAGIVHDLQITSLNAVLRPAEPVLYVVPTDRPMIVAARIDARQVDAVFSGQPAALHFSAFQSRTTPEIIGTVRRLSPDVLTDPQTGQQYYAVFIETSPDQLARLGEVTLVPGMPVEAFIQTGTRTPLDYLLRPLADYFARAFREE
jgi:HlyD family secretion protein